MYLQQRQYRKKKTGTDQAKRKVCRLGHNTITLYSSLISGIVNGYPIQAK